MTDPPAWLAAARTAPSAHNTQPWRFQILPDGRIAVCWAPDRALPAGDPTNRDLLLGLGAAVESACLGAAFAGEPLRFVPVAAGRERTAGWLIADPSAPLPDDLRLARSLGARHTARLAHVPGAVPADAMATLQREAKRCGRSLHIVTDVTRIRLLAALARQATAAQFADSSVQAEVWRWLRLDRQHPAYTRDGLTAGCLNLRGAALAIARGTMPPRRMRLLVRLSVHHALALDTQQVVRHSASLCLLTTPAVDQRSLIETGRLLLRLWLLASGYGLTTHPISALLDCPDTQGAAIALCGASGELPACIFRLGATPSVERAPRLPWHELVGESGG